MRKDIKKFAVVQMAMPAERVSRVVTSDGICRWPPKEMKRESHSEASRYLSYST